MKTLLTTTVTVLLMTMSAATFAEISKGSHFTPATLYDRTNSQLSASSFSQDTSGFERTHINQKTEATLTQSAADKTFMGEHMGNLYRSLRKMQNASLDGNTEGTLKYQQDAVTAFNKAYFNGQAKASGVFLDGADGVQFLDSNGANLEGKPTMVSDYNRLELSVLKQHWLKISRMIMQPLKMVQS